MKELKEMTMAELVAEYNKLSKNKPIKKFASKAHGMVRIKALLDTIAVVSKKPLESKKQTRAIGHIKNRARDLINAHKNLDNTKFSELSAFRKMCDQAGIKASKRQASKFRRCMGLAYLLV